MHKRALFLLLSLTLVLSACNRNGVTIESFDPAGEVDKFTTFNIVFSNDLAPHEALGEWSDEAYVEFDPPIPGKFKWENPNHLVFSPDIALEPAMDYEAKITDLVLFGAEGVSGDFEKQHFHTAYFEPTGLDFFQEPVERGNYSVNGKVNLYFNYKVDPAVLKDYIEIRKGTEKLESFTIATQHPAEIIAIDLGQQSQAEQATNFTVVIGKGLESVETASGLRDKKEFAFELPPLTRLAIVNTASGVDGNDGWIEVFTTQKVDEKSLKKYITLDPKKKFDVSVASNSFRITGAFTPGSTTEMLIKEGLPGLYGGTLDQEYKETIFMADLEPSLRFAEGKGKYLMRSGLKNLEVNAINVEKMEVEFYEVFENNILFFLTQNSYYYDYYWDYDEYYYGNSYNVDDFGKLMKVDESETEVEFGSTQNRKNKHMINLEGKLDRRYRGAMVVTVRDAEDCWRRDSKIVISSDLGMIVKQSRDGMHVFVNELETTNPAAGVEVSVISTNNQTLMTGTTDANGVAVFDDFVKKTEEFTPRLVTASKGKDFNYVDLRETNIETSRFDVGGKTEYHKEYETFIYADRNLYRPGETAHVSAILRDKKIGIVNDIPVVMKVINPRGRTYKTFTEKLNKEGSFDQEVEISASSPTGMYKVELYTGSDEILGYYSFNVEEFVPDKIRVMATADKEIVKPGEEIEIKVESEYLFGAPAARHDYEIDVRLTHASFRSKKYNTYNFSNSSVDNTYLENLFVNETLDEEGKTTEAFSIPKDIDAKGIISGSAYASVFDASGRTVTRVVPFTSYPNSYYIGLDLDQYYYGLNKPIPLKIAVVDPEDKDKSNFSVEVEVIRKVWKTVLRKNSGGNWRYVSENFEEVAIAKKPVSVSGSKVHNFQVAASGNYEIRVYAKGSKNYMRQSFYAYGYAQNTASSFEVDKEGKIEIVLDKDKYEPGEKAKVLFTTPFSGKMLVSIEREEVMQYEFIEVENNSAELSINIGEEHLPNAYISATLFHTHTENSPTPFLVAHGYQNISVEAESRHLEVKIEAPEKIKPRTTQEIVIKTRPDEAIYVTLAVVDEGILQIKNFQTPDPFGYMYAKRRLNVDSYDMYELLLPEVSGSMASPGGGDDGSAKRMNPFQAERFKLLSHWSGIRKTDANGEVRIRVPIPQFNGEARIMAVAYSGSAFGSASKPMKIADDVVMLPSIPRVLSITDSLSLPVTLMNTTDKSGKVNVKIKVEGPLTVTSKDVQTASFKGKGTQRVNFGIKASEAPGIGKITLLATGLDNVTNEIEISVRPISPLRVVDGSGSIKAGQSKTLSVPSNFLPESQNSTLIISKFPGVKLTKHLKYLVGYPYGCLEQTTSKAFPQLYFEDLASVVNDKKNYSGNPVYFVNEAITKISGMQMSGGAFSYWPGSYSESWWGSAYAGHFLVEAEKAGYQVPEQVIDRMLNYLSREAGERRTYDYHSYKNGAWSTKVMANKETIYSLYVLALAGKGDLSLMNYYRARPHLLTSDCRYLLGGAYALMKDWGAYKEIVPELFSPEMTSRNTGGNFDSEVRSNAIMLNVLMDVDPNSPQIPLLIKHLEKLSDKWYSTQDKAWVFLGLGKAARRTAGSNVKVEVQAGGKTLTNFTGKNLKFSDDAMNGKKVVLKGTGTGEVYYYWSSEGIPADGSNTLPEEDKYISVRRTYYDRTGNKLDGNNFRQGDLIVCKLELSTGIKSVENMVISDLVPAGFEIENPRLGNSASLAWLDTDMYPDYLDVRDDRLLVFTSMSSNQKRSYFYMVRAVNSGTFRLPPVGAEAMYDPEFHSYHGARTIRVSPKGFGGI